MRDVRTDEPATEAGLFPLYGARARVWGRFDRDLRAWLDTPEGRFAAWRAAAATAAPPRDEPRR